jgi:hypothetical protein
MPWNSPRAFTQAPQGSIEVTSSFAIHLCRLGEIHRGVLSPVQEKWSEYEENKRQMFLLRQVYHVYMNKGASTNTIAYSRNTSGVIIANICDFALGISRITMRIPLPKDLLEQFRYPIFL